MESLQRYDEIIHTSYAINLPLFLVFNKFDVFQDKMKRGFMKGHPFDDCRNRITTQEELLSVIISKYTQINRNKDRLFVTYVTTLMNEGNCKIIMENVCKKLGENKGLKFDEGPIFVYCENQSKFQKRILEILLREMNSNVRFYY